MLISRHASQIYSNLLLAGHLLLLKNSTLHLSLRPFPTSVTLIQVLKEQKTRLKRLQHCYSK